MRRANEHVVARAAVGRRSQVVDLAVDEVKLSFVPHHQAIALYRHVLRNDAKIYTGQIQQLIRSQINVDCH